MYLRPGKFFRNQILLDYLGWWHNQSYQIFFQSVHSGVFGKGSNFAIFSANRRWPLQLLYYCTTVIQTLSLCQLNLTSIIYSHLYYFLNLFLAQCLYQAICTQRASKGPTQVIKGSMSMGYDIYLTLPGIELTVSQPAPSPKCTPIPCGHSYLLLLFFKPSHTCSINVFLYFWN